MRQEAFKWAYRARKILMLLTLKMRSSRGDIEGESNRGVGDWKRL